MIFFKFRGKGVLPSLSKPAIYRTHTPIEVGSTIFLPDILRGLQIEFFLIQADPHLLNTI